MNTYNNSSAEFSGDPDPTLPALQRVIETMGAQAEDDAVAAVSEAEPTSQRPTPHVEVSVGLNDRGDLVPTRLMLQQDLSTASVSMHAYALMLSQGAAVTRRAELNQLVKSLSLGMFPTMFEYIDAIDEAKAELAQLERHLAAYGEALDDIFIEDVIVVEGPDVAIVYEGILKGLATHADGNRLRGAERKAFLEGAMQGISYLQAPNNAEA
jgi:hypothetical protein